MRRYSEHEPRDLVATLEASPRIPVGPDEGYDGYALFGMPFASGHYLGLRRFPSAPVAGGFTSVWYRDPAGAWTIYSDAAPRCSCARYFGAGLTAARETPISLEWPGPRTFHVEIPDELDWQVTLGSTTGTRVLSALAPWLPERVMRNDRWLATLEPAATLLLRSGRISLRGVAPNQQWYQVNPRRLWVVRRSRAIVRGKDVGPMGPLAQQTRLGDLWLPQRGLFTAYQAYLAAFDDSRHSAVTRVD